jgi:hypothetical protein
MMMISKMRRRRRTRRIALKLLEYHIIVEYHLLI